LTISHLGEEIWDLLRKASKACGLIWAVHMVMMVDIEYVGTDHTSVSLLLILGAGSLLF